MISMIQRMCWNSRGWLMPTGNSSDGGYPGENGYGYEEWNFQIEDAFEGNLYAYMYFRPSQTTIEEAKGHFKIGFWTLHPDSRIRLLVGIYHDATLATNQELTGLYKYFDSKGIFQRRSEELVNVVPNLKYRAVLSEMQNHFRKKWTCWKCPVEKVESFPRYIQLPNKINGKRVGAYFTRPTFVRETFFRNLKLISPKKHTSLQQYVRKSPLAEDAYYRESSRNLRVIIPRHNQLSNQFCNWLRKIGVSKIIQETNQVDVFFKTNKGSYLAELKVCYAVGSTKSIREALGQLLEYNFYSWRTPANKWIIILDEVPSNADKEFIIRLTKELSLPLYIGWKSPKGFSFVDHDGEF